MILWETCPPQCLWLCPCLSSTTVANSKAGCVSLMWRVLRNVFWQREQSKQVLHCKKMRKNVLKENISSEVNVFFFFFFFAFLCCFFCPSPQCLILTSLRPLSNGKQHLKIKYIFWSVLFFLIFFEESPPFTWILMTPLSKSKVSKKHNWIYKMYKHNVFFLCFFAVCRLVCHSKCEVKVRNKACLIFYIRHLKKFFK